MASTPGSDEDVSVSARTYLEGQRSRRETGLTLGQSFPSTSQPGPSTSGDPGLTTVGRRRSLAASRLHPPLRSVPRLLLCRGRTLGVSWGFSGRRLPSTPSGHTCESRLVDFRTSRSG